MRHYHFYRCHCTILALDDGLRYVTRHPSTVTVHTSNDHVETRAVAYNVNLLFQYPDDGDEDDDDNNNNDNDDDTDDSDDHAALG